MTKATNQRGAVPLGRLTLNRPVNAGPAQGRRLPIEHATRDDGLDGPPSEVRPIVSLSAVPRLAVTAEGLRSLPIDATTAYLLSLVDGQSTVQAILDVCEPELRRDDALGLFAWLLQLRAIELSGS